MKSVIGIDEVGRGPFAGPVTVCAAFTSDKKRLKKEIFANSIRDSKMVSKSFRNNVFKTINKNKKFSIYIKYAIASRSASYIDKHGLTHAIESCVLTCLTLLEKQGVATKDTQINLDAGLSVPSSVYKQKSFIKGDEKFAEIALASILAKEYRDRYMQKLHRFHVEYGWNTNAGYGTKMHREAITRYGITKYHRKLFLKKFKLFDKK